MGRVEQAKQNTTPHTHTNKQKNIAPNQTALNTLALALSPSLAPHAQTAHAHDKLTSCRTAHKNHPTRRGLPDAPETKERDERL